jgi:lauroyl/myristoyl acyltransferase
MDEIKTYLSSPSWWFTAVLVAIFVNLISSYLKPWLDSIGSKMSSRIRERSERKRKNIQKIINDLSQNPQDQLLMSQSAIQMRLKGIGFFIYLLLYFIFIETTGIRSLFVNTLFGIITVFSSVIGMRYIWRSYDAEYYVEASRRDSKSDTN